MVVERDTKAVQVFVISDDHFVLAPPSSDGWTLVAPIDVEIRAEQTPTDPVLHVRMRGESATARTI